MIAASRRLLFLAAASCALAAPAFAAQLTLAEAHAIALRNHPRAAVAGLQVEAAEAGIEASRSAYLPSAAAVASAVEAGNENTRILAGGLNNPSIYDRTAGGLAVSQLITDFGRTLNLTAGSKLLAKAAAQDASSIRQQVLLAVDASYYGALQAQALLRVADQTLQTRRLLVDQVTALAASKLKSALDVSFARVALEEAELLHQRAAGNAEASGAALSTALGYDSDQHFELAEPTSPVGPPADAVAAIEAARRDRPDLARLRFQRDAALRFARAENDLSGPTLTAVGTIGDAVSRDVHLPQHYAAGGINLNLPLFTGGLYDARQRQARIEAEIAGENLRDADDQVARDVQIAWVNLRTALQREVTAQQLMLHAGEAYQLALARYQAGSSSIVELSQAELEQTDAQIEQADARYGALLARSAYDFQLGSLQ